MLCGGEQAKSQRQESQGQLDAEVLELHFSTVANAGMVKGAELLRYFRGACPQNASSGGPSFLFLCTLLALSTD